MVWGPGIGSFYYLTFAFGTGLSERMPELCESLIQLCLATVTLSIILHGITVTPLMSYYERNSGTS